MSTILGTLFVFCGLLGGVAFFAEAAQGMSIGSFIQGFAVSVWPLAAGCVLFILMQILREVCVLREKAEHPQTAALSLAPAQPQAPKTAPAPELAEELTPSPPTKAPAGPVYFPVRETAQGPRIIRRVEAPTEAANAATNIPTETAPVMEIPTEVTPAPSPEPVDDGRTFFKTR